MIDKTDYNALENLKKVYKDQIVDYKYKVWKEAYLDKPPRGAFCTGITRYRKCMKVTHVVLNDGRLIPVGGSDTNGCLICTIFLAFVILLLLCSR